MGDVIPFVPKKRRVAKAALNAYVDWAKAQIRNYDKPYDPVQWGGNNWFRWGLKRTSFSKLGNPDEGLSLGFIDYAKAMIFEERAVKLVEDQCRLYALRCLEVALIDITDKNDVTTVTSAVFDKACVHAQEYYDSYQTAYHISRHLKRIYFHLHELGVVAVPFLWEPQLKPPVPSLKESEENSNKKLPSDESLVSLGEIFHSKPELPLDIMTTSVVAIMLSQPCRVGELKYLKKDCLFTEFDELDNEQLYMLWYSVKGFGFNRKVIIDSMAGICREAVNRVVDITQEARDYAKWLEDNSESFPYHAGVPEKGLDSPLTLQETCNALMLSTEKRTPRTVFKKFLLKMIEAKKTSAKAKIIAENILSGFDLSKGVRVFYNGKLSGYVFEDTFVITLRDLNFLVRDKYLPDSFPYTDEKRIIKWKNALFCFRTGVFRSAGDNGELKPFGITGCSSSRLSAQFSGIKGRVPSIFDRHGYYGVKVNSHAFRHFLNTGAQRAGMSEDIIARWSGRDDIRQNKVYNHITVDEEVSVVEEFAPQVGVKNNELLSALKTNIPISMRDLGENNDQVVHRTEFGVCVHDYAQEPCAKFNNCLTCGEHVCVKGDETKLENLKEEREYLMASLGEFRKEASRGAYGANSWLSSSLEKLDRCNQLIRILENPDLEDGALVKGVENGWTSSRNALVMRGEVVDEDASLIATDSDYDNVAELERLLGS